MYSNFKKKSFYHRLLDKWQRRNKGKIDILLLNYLAYLKYKIFFQKKNSRGHILQLIRPNSFIAEVGVWKGSFSLEIYKNCKPKEIVLVDSWIFDKDIRGCAPMVGGEEPLSQKFFDKAYEETKFKFAKFSNVKIYKQDSYNTSKLIKDNYFDYIYIDAEHSYKAVSLDLENWYPKLKKNGYIFGDDYHWREKDGTLSVARAYQDFFAKYNINSWCVFKSQICFKKL